MDMSESSNLHYLDRISPLTDVLVIPDTEVELLANVTLDDQLIRTIAKYAKI
jgi:hypothetical protein